MSLNSRYSLVARNAVLDAMADLADDGYLRIYDGVQPATPEDAPEGTLLAELRFAATAFGPAAHGVAIAYGLTADSSANATGTATWFRVVQSDGTTAVWDGSLGTSGCNLNFASTNIQAGAAVSVSAFSLNLTMQGT